MNRLIGFCRNQSKTRRTRGPLVALLIAVSISGFIAAAAPAARTAADVPTLSAVPQPTTGYVAATNANDIYLGPYVDQSAEAASPDKEALAAASAPVNLLLVQREELSLLQRRINEASFAGKWADQADINRFVQLYSTIYGDVPNQTGLVLMMPVQDVSIMSSASTRAAGVVIYDDPIAIQEKAALAISGDEASPGNDYADQLQRAEQKERYYAMQARVLEESASQSEIDAMDKLGAELGMPQAITEYEESEQVGHDGRGDGTIDQGSTDTLSNCASATLIASCPFNDTGNFDGDNDCSVIAVSPSNDVFYRFVPAVTGFYQLRARSGSGGNVAVRVVSGGCCAGAIAVGFSSNSVATDCPNPIAAGNEPSTVVTYLRVTLTAGTTYWIHVGTSSTTVSTATYDFQLWCVGCPVSEPNDTTSHRTCTTALSMTVNDSLMGDSAITGREDWYTFTKTGQDSVLIFVGAREFGHCLSGAYPSSTPSAPVDARYSLWKNNGTCPGDSIGSADDEGCSLDAKKFFCLDAGTYYIKVRNFGEQDYVVKTQQFGACTPPRPCASCTPIDANLDPLPNSVYTGTIGGNLGNGGKWTGAFTAVANNIYHFDLCPLVPGAGTASGDFDIKINDGTCTILAYIDGSGCSGAGSSFLPNDFQWTAPSSGLRYISIEPYVTGGSTIHNCTGTAANTFTLQYYEEIPPAINLTVSILAPCGTQAPNPAATVSLRVTNTGGAATPATIARYDFNSGFQLDNFPVPPLAPASFFDVFFTVPLNLTIGTHSLVGSVDAVAGETNTLDNSTNCTITVQRPCNSCSPFDAALNPMPAAYGGGPVSGNCGNGGKWVGQFNAVAGRVYHFDLCPDVPGNGTADFDIDVRILDGACQPLVPNVGEDGSCSVSNVYRSNNFSWTATTTGSYHLILAPYSSYNSYNCIGTAANTFTLDYYEELPVPPPANDDCANAIGVAVPSSTAGTTAGALIEVPAVPTCNSVSQTSGGVWYTVTGTGTLLQASTCVGSAFDTRVSVYTGTCGSFTCITADDNFCSSQAQAAWCSVFGTTYYVLVHGSGTGTFQLDIIDTGIGAPPTNDDCANAITVGVPSYSVGATTCATPEVPAPTVCGTTYSGANGVWYKVAGNDHTLTATLCNANTDYDTKLFVFTGTCGSLTCVTGNDDNSLCATGPGTPTYKSLVTWCSVAGTDYYVLVTGFSTSSGLYGLDVSSGACCNPRVHNLTQLLDYCTINAAIQAANPGDVVSADAGTFTENVYIDRALTLQGPNANIDPRSDCPGGVRNPEAIIDGGAVSAAVQIAADNVTVIGFTIRGAENGLEAGVYVDASRQAYNVAYNVITDNAMGMYANSAGAAAVHHNSFSANNRPGAAGGAGIYSEYTNNLTIRDNEFFAHPNNNPVIFAATGPSVHNALGFLRNNLHDDYGVFAIAIGSGLFQGNRMSAAAAATACTFGGGCTNVVFEQNIVSNSMRGLRIADFGYGLGDNSNIEAHNNSFDSATLTQFSLGVLSGYTTTFDASNNWWGSNVAASVVAAIDNSGAPVDYTPWLNTGTELTPDVCDGFQGDFHTLWVDDDSPQSGVINRVQEGVYSLTASTLNLMPGTYEGQVVATGFTTLNIVGSGALNTFVTAPTVLPHYFDIGGGPRKAILSFEGNGTVNISNLTVDGLGRGSGNSSFIGIAYLDGGGSVSDVTVTAIRENPINGVQSGVGIWAVKTTAGAATFTVQNVIVSDYQKNGFVVSGNLNCIANNVSITGAGAVNFIAQNGFQLSALSLVAGNVDISGNEYTPYTVTSTGFLFYDGPTVTITGSDLLNNQTSVYAEDTDGGIDASNIISNSVGGTGVFPYATGFALANLPQQRRLTERFAEGGVSKVREKTSRDGQSLDDPHAFAVTNCTITGDYVAGSAGVYAYADGDNLDLTVDNNDITKWDLGIAVDADAPGTIAPAVVTDNYFKNNSNTFDDTPGHTWDRNCYHDYALNAGWPGTYEIPGASPVNVDYNPNPSACANVTFTVTDETIGCNEPCSQDTLYLTFDQAGFIAGQLFIQLPPELDADWVAGTGYFPVYPGTNVATNLVFAAARRSAGNQIEVNVQWQPPYSDGDGSKYIACIPFKNVTGVDGQTLCLTGGASTFYNSGGPLVNVFALGTACVTVECAAPAVTFTPNSAPACNAINGPAGLVGAYSVTALRGTGSPLVQGYVEVNGNALQRVYLFNSVLPLDYSNASVFSAGDAATVYGWLDEDCNSLVWYAVDDECNVGSSAAVTVIKDTTAPAVSVTNLDETFCYNDNNAGSNYGGNLLDDKIDINVTLDPTVAAPCAAGSGTLAISYLGGTPLVINLPPDLAGYPTSDPEALALWTWILTQVPGTADGESYTFDLNACDCVGNCATASFTICIDLTAPANTVVLFDARPTDLGIWLKWSWNYSASQAVEMQVWRSPADEVYPTYGAQLWDQPANPAAYAQAYPPAGWTMIASQNGAIATTSTLYTGLNGKGNNNHSGPGLMYWEDEDASWVDNSEDRDIYRYVTYVRDNGGNWSLTAGYTINTNADRATNYWLGDYSRDAFVSPDPSDGIVDGPDLGLLSTVYFTSVIPATQFYDIGAENAENGIGRGIPTPDGLINFLDLVPFSFNFGIVLPNSFNVRHPNTPPFAPNLDDQPVVSIVPLPDQYIEVGGTFRVAVTLTSNEQHSVKIAETMLNFDPNVLEVVSTTTGTFEVMDGTPFSSVRAIDGTNRVGLVAAALGEIAQLTDGVTLGTIEFRWKAQGEAVTELALNDVQMSDGFGNIMNGSNSTASINANGAIPRQFSLHQNFPNPFNPSTSIQFDLPENSFVKLSVYNLLGQEVRTLINGSLEAGQHNVEWNGLDNTSQMVGSGLYIYTIQAGNHSASKKMMFLR